MLQCMIRQDIGKRVQFNGRTAVSKTAYECSIRSTCAIWKVGRGRFNASVLKTDERGERSVGSNPTPSSNICSVSLVVRTQAFHAWYRGSIPLPNTNNMREWRNGRRARLRIWCLMACGFESHLPYQYLVPSFIGQDDGLSRHRGGFDSRWNRQLQP